MERSLKLANRNNKSTVAITLADDRMIAIGLFLIALGPRLLALGKFITADEPRWAIRSVSFLTGLLTTDWLLTLDTPGHPGVTTMWSGTLGLIMDYALNHQAAGSLLAFVQSLPDNYQRIDPTVLPWMRLPIVVLAAVSVAAIFWFLRSLNRNLAIIAALLLAFHPLHLAHSQLLHHDALVSIFALFSILFYLTALRRWSWTLIALSGVMAGLAFLSKSTAYALIPFVGLVMLVELFSRRQTFKQAVLAGLLWVGAALVSVIALWPAIWVAPLDVWQTVYNWINQSAEAGSILETLSADFSEGFPDLGVFFYPVNWLLKTTPLMMLGLLFFIFWWRRASSASQARWWAGRLLLWIGLFSLMLTLGDKRDGRYLLPIYFALCILAALGLQFIYQRLKHLRPFRVNLRVAQTNAYQIGFAILLVGFSVTFYPYYLTYYNPLAGGSWAAAKLIRVGWGDGMEEAAAWLNAQPNAGQLRVATIIEQSFWPFFDGQIAPPDTHRAHTADYVLNYHRQIQNGVPFREFWEYYRARPAAFKLRVAGIDYVWLHQEPPLAKIDRIPFGDQLILRAYTTDQPLAAPGRPLDVTLIWRTNSPTQEVARLQLRDEAGHLQAESEPAPVIDPNGPSAVEGHYSLNLPEALPRGTYPLWASVGEKDDWTEVAAIPVGRTAPATDIRDPLEVNFARRILLRGIEFSPSVVAPGTRVNLEFHWQAVQPMTFAFTTFIHLRDGEGQVVAQSDVQPGQGRWPTNTWNRHEWITDHVSLAVPADLPAGDYQLWAGWYHLESGQRLPLADDETEDSVLLGTITVP